MNQNLNDSCCFIDSKPQRKTVGFAVSLGKSNVEVCRKMLFMTEILKSITGETERGREAGERKPQQKHKVYALASEDSSY